MIAGALKNNIVTKVYEVAARGVLSKIQRETNGTHTVVLNVPGSKAESFLAIIQALGIKGFDLTTKQEL